MNFNQRKHRKFSRVEKKVSKGDKAVKNLVRQAKLNGHILSAQGRGLTKIPREVLEVKQWVELDLSSNLINEWPVVDVYRDLDHLILSGNKLKSIGPSIGRLTNLKTLHINGNLLERLPPDIGKLHQLTILDLQNNKLLSLPREIGDLRSLEEFTLSGNPLIQVPKEMGKLKRLQLLDLSCCSLSTLPPEFCQMSSLLDLNLGRNQLTSLPNTWDTMSRLVVLKLDGNQINRIPITLGACCHISQILLDGNPIEDEKLMAQYSISSEHMMRYWENEYFSWKQHQKRKERKKQQRQDAIGRKPKSRLSVSDGVKKSPRRNSERMPRIQISANQPKSNSAPGSPRSPKRGALPPEKYKRLVEASANIVRTLLAKIEIIAAMTDKTDDVPSCLPIARIISGVQKHLDTIVIYIQPIVQVPVPIPTSNQSQFMRLKQLTLSKSKQNIEIVKRMQEILMAEPSIQHLSLIARTAKQALESLNV
mmetsp:Transcript_30029/g.33536  ORF Transcript_30029/g.33536 Transcript_30029/m.33536 type:complete len:478 (-) Transcript_30029:27-1460(-)